MSDRVFVFLPEITHNPWHPTYELTAEAQRRVKTEIAVGWRQRMVEEHPGCNVFVQIGDEGWAGSVPNKVVIE